MTMSGYYTKLVLAVFVSFFCQDVSSRRIITTEYVTRNCDNSILVIYNAIIQLDSYMVDPLKDECEVIIKSDDSSKHIQLSFLEFNVPCDEASLTISGFNLFSDSEVKLCGPTRPTQQYTSYLDRLTITFKKTSTSGSSSSAFHFKLLASNIRTGFCTSLEFACNNLNCVDDYELNCNGYDNCGDNSDETKGCLLQPGTLAGIILGCLAAVFLIVVIFIVIYRKKKYGSICNRPRTHFVATQNGKPQQAYGQPQLAYGQPQQAYGQPQQAYGQPQQVFGQVQPMYGPQQPMYGQTNAAMMPPSYAQAVAAPGQAPPSTTVDSKPAGNP